MDKPKTTPKDFFLWAGAMIAFYWSVIAYIYLVFDYINYAFPNALSYYPADPYQSGISFEMASVIVLFPVSVFLMWLIRKDAFTDPSRKEIWVRRWALILTLFVAGIAIAADLITLLTTFLNGEALTTAFLLKVLVIILVAAGVFMHFFADLKNYWDTNPSRRMYVRIGVAVLAVVTIGSGFVIVGTPAEARLARFDAQRVSDLQSIQSQVVYYWQAKQKLPATLNDLNDSISGYVVPIDPVGPDFSGPSYAYVVDGPLAFKLCASFSTESRGNQNVYSETRAVMPPAPTPAGEKAFLAGKGAVQDNWSHSSGRVCFDRTIDPSFYPPLKP